MKYLFLILLIIGCNKFKSKANHKHLTYKEFLIQCEKVKIVTRPEPADYGICEIDPCNDICYNEVKL